MLSKEPKKIWTSEVTNVLQNVFETSYSRVILQKIIAQKYLPHT